MAANQLKRLYAGEPCTRGFHRMIIRHSGSLVPIKSIFNVLRGGHSRVVGAYRESAMKTLLVNGIERSIEVPEEMPLLWVLRDVIGLTGTKYGAELHNAARVRCTLTDTLFVLVYCPCRKLPVSQSLPLKRLKTTPWANKCKRPGSRPKLFSVDIASQGRS